MANGNKGKFNAKTLRTVLIVAVLIIALVFLWKKGLLGEVLNSLLGNGEQAESRVDWIVDSEEEQESIQDSKNDSKQESKQNSKNDSKQESKQNSKNDSKQESKQNSNTVTKNGVTVTKGKKYTSRDEVALYLYSFHELPPNFISKNDAKKKGWNESGGKDNNLWKVTDHMSLGGTYYGNYEGILPTKNNGSWCECDIDFEGTSRGTKRIVYSTKDWSIYYTSDHYESYSRYNGETGKWEKNWK